MSFFVHRHEREKCSFGKAAREAAAKEKELLEASVRQLPGPKLFLGPSKIHGKGLFANKFIKVILFMFVLFVLGFLFILSIHFFRLAPLFVSMLANCSSLN